MAGNPDDPNSAAVELPSRLVFSLMQAAVRVAARVHIPLKRLQELLRTAYFLEYRRRHPRDLQTVADKLGVSLRTAGTLNRSLRDAFFSPETEVEPIRQITGTLLRAPRSAEELEQLTGMEAPEVARSLKHLVEVGWVEKRGGAYHLAGALRSFVTEDLPRRVDGINHQLAVVGDSVWARFVQGNEETAGGRTWAFAARPEDIAVALERSFNDLRAEAIRMEEAALEDGVTERFAITIAFTPLEEDT